MAGHDVLAKSKTGSGKTLGLRDPDRRATLAGLADAPAVILVPTRELAVQVAEEFDGICAASRTAMSRSRTAARGSTIRARRPAMAHVVIATPGRLVDLAERKFVRLDRVSILILDEADRMLDMGFQPQVDRIVRQLPKKRQTMFFSATLDGAVGRIASAYTRDARLHEIEAPKQTVDNADHRFIPVGTHDKVDALVEVLGEDDRKLALVFVRTKRGADRLVGTSSSSRA